MHVLSEFAVFLPVLIHHFFWHVSAFLVPARSLGDAMDAELVDVEDVLIPVELAEDVDVVEEHVEDGGDAWLGADPELSEFEAVGGWWTAVASGDGGSRRKLNSACPSGARRTLRGSEVGAGRWWTLVDAGSRWLP